LASRRGNITLDFNCAIWRAWWADKLNWHASDLKPNQISVKKQHVRHAERNSFQVARALRKSLHGFKKNDQVQRRCP
jgi:hypothetical protein